MVPRHKQHPDWLSGFSTVHAPDQQKNRQTRQRIGDRAFSVAAPRAWNTLPTLLKLLRSTITCPSSTENIFVPVCLQCFDAVGWATGRASGL